MINAPELLLAFVVDVVVGDPRGVPHPVVVIGQCIEWLEPRLRSRMDAATGGVVLVVLVAGGTLFSAWIAAYIIRSLYDTMFAFVAVAAYIWLASTTLALRGLVDAVREVLECRDLQEARRKLAGIVGRETATLDEEGVARAAIETLAENTSDAVVAPLLYLAIGGLPLALFYKAVNTLDSMVGYKNERYLHFGRTAARLDDVMNYLPARLTGWLLVGAAWVLSGFASKSTDEAARTMRVMLRDGGKHTSPNAGIPEAAIAGALDIRLGGPSVYGGVVVEKPYINDSDEAAERGSAAAAGRRAVTLCTVASLLAAGLLASLAWLLHA